MCAVCHGATIVSDQQVGMMVLLMGDLRDDINKRHGLVIILKAVGVADGLLFAI